jgi:tetratricopeptide (TPR) repeat protein
MNTQKLLEKADSFLLAQRHEQARSICNKILKRDPACLHALFIMGKCSAAGEKYSAATRYFKRLFDYDPSRKQVLLEIGNSLRLSGDYDAAIPYLREALQYDQSHQHYLELGFALSNANEPDEAKRCFLSALAIKPGCHMSIKNLGIIARDQGDLDEARARFRQLIDIDPEYPFSYNELIMVGDRGAPPARRRRGDDGRGPVAALGGVVREHDLPPDGVIADVGAHQGKATGTVW